ncbi:MAG: NrfD/PsrC family molybdoenzyme membrane anchor subunit [Acidimicrobiia bacterium]
MTAETMTKRELPQGVGMLTPGWLAFFAVAIIAAVAGLLAYTNQLNQGMIVTGLRDLGTVRGAPWSLYVAFDVYFVGVSFAGISTAALIRLFNIEKLKSVARMAELLTVVALLLAALAIMADLGQPLRGIVNLFRYGRPQSPFFGTFALVIAGYLFASLAYLYITSRKDAARLAERPSRLRGLYRVWAAGYKDTPAQRQRDRLVTFWLALAILPLLITAHSSLGFVFGLQVGRPGWFGSLQAPAFVVMAGVSGIGHLIILAALVRSALRADRRITIDVFAWLGRLLLVLVFTYLYFTVVEVLTTIYQASATEQGLSDALLTGRYAWIFWGSIASLLAAVAILGWMALMRSWSVGWSVFAGILVNVAAVGKRYLIVVPSQTHGQLLPYGTGSYSPTWVEYVIIAGLFALGALMIGGFMKIFPIMPMEEGE